MERTEQAGSPDGILDALGSLLTADGLFCVDLDQRIVLWSESAARVIGLKAHDVVGRSCYEVIGGKRLFAYPYCRPDCPVLANARRRRPTRDFDVRITSGDEQRWLNVSIVLTDDSDRQSPLVMHLIRDVTDQRSVDALSAAAGREETMPIGRRSREAGAVSPLSRREQQVIRLLAHGYSTSSVAEALGLSPVTVRNHITRAMSKLGVHSRLDAVVRAARYGIV
jgi:PAS domain S-box-containing protein